MRARRTRRCYRSYGLTLIEVLLAIGILAIISAMAVPALLRQFEREKLPTSAHQLRSLLTLVRANASFDGKRFRIRFPEIGEKDARGGNQQPLVEREDDAIDDPGVYNLVTAPWAVVPTIVGDVWCAEVRLGRPTVERLRSRSSKIKDAVDKALEDFNPDRPPLLIEPDGSSDWVTFVLTTAPRGVSLDGLEDYERLEVIADGVTGQAWVQRSLYAQELDLFEEKNWPVVLRQDFLDPRVLGENDVLELLDMGGGS